VDCEKGKNEDNEMTFGKRGECERDFNGSSVLE